MTRLRDMTPTPKTLWDNLSPAAQWVLRELRGDAWISEKTLRDRFADLFGSYQAEGLGTTLGQLVLHKRIQQKTAGGSFHYRARAEGLELLRAAEPAPEPDPEPVPTVYSVAGSAPELFVGVSDKGRVLLGEKPNGGGVNWTHVIDNVDALQQVLEQARVDQGRIEREL